MPLAFFAAIKLAVTVLGEGAERDAVVSVEEVMSIRHLQK
ncbi:hypothetical protein WH7805_09629 [Synechococcus sp. WH 7805]|nr:hypothetical protein WH7805_09629 [Synechococcus sp. WH 7805]